MKRSLGKFGSNENSGKQNYVRFKSLELNSIKNIIHSIYCSHVQPGSSLFQPCLCIKVAFPMRLLSFISASSQHRKFSIFKERFLKRLMIIAKFYSERGRWGEIPRFSGKSPPRRQNKPEKQIINYLKNEKHKIYK